MGNDVVLKAQVAGALIRLEAMHNLTSAQAKAIVSLRADLNRMVDVELELAARVLELERQVSALQKAIRPRSV